MTSPGAQSPAEHARLAELLLDQARDELQEASLAGEGAARARFDRLVAAAQVHATLSLRPEPLEPVAGEPVEWLAGPRGRVLPAPGDRVVVLSTPSLDSAIGITRLGTVVSMTVPGADRPMIDVDLGDGTPTRTYDADRVRVVL